MGRRLRIGVDAHGTRGLRSGLGHYLRAILREWSGLDHGHELVLFCAQEDREAFALPGVRHHAGPRLHGSAAYDLAWHSTVLPALCRAYRLDALFVAVDRRVPALCPVPVVATVHDLAPYALPDKYPASRRWYNLRVLPALLRRCRELIAISEHTRQGLRRHLGIDPASVHVIRHGVEPGRFTAVPPAQVERTLRRLGVARPYALYPARLEHPGKNHVRLVRALREVDPRLHLVCPGGAWHGHERIVDEIRRCGLAGRVHLAGFVSDDDLAALYRGAELVALPSLHEGCGLPALEAMAAGVPLAASRAPALPEFAGDAARWFDPLDERDIARALRDLHDDRDLRERLVERGRRRARAFSWARSARRTLAVIEAAAGRRAPRASDPIDRDVQMARGSRCISSIRSPGRWRSASSTSSSSSAACSSR